MTMGLSERLGKEILEIHARNRAPIADLLDSKLEDLEDLALELDANLTELDGAREWVKANNPDEALDVWLKIPADEEEAEYEANTYKRDGRFTVEWYHTAVGQVSSRSFDTHELAREFLTKNGFDDYTS